jgi:hypothetical protein
MLSCGRRTTPLAARVGHRNVSVRTGRITTVRAVHAAAQQESQSEAQQRWWDLGVSSNHAWNAVSVGGIAALTVASHCAPEGLHMGNACYSEYQVTISFDTSFFHLLGLVDASTGAA